MSYEPIRIALSLIVGTLLCTGIRCQDRPVSPNRIELSSSLGEKGNFVNATLPDAYAEEGEVISFWLKRTFGWMAIGEAESDADGVCKFPVPRYLVRDRKGGLEIRASYPVPDEKKSLESTIVLPIGARSPSDGWAIPPRELWSSRAPLSLLLTIIVLYGSVWTAYVVVFVKLWKIKQSGVGVGT